jgi:purine-binding chemotaxis protein CheW
MSPQKKKKLEAAIDNLFSAPRIKTAQNQVTEIPPEPLMEVEPSPIPTQQIPPPPLDSSAPAGEAAKVASVAQLTPSADLLPVKEPVVVAPSPSYVEPVQTAPPIQTPKMPDPAPTQITPAIGEENSEGVQMVIFMLDGQYYGIGIETVDSIIKMQAITELPHAPHFIVGLTNLRGKVLPVISLRKRFGFAEQETTKNSRIIVINVEQKEAGLIVDGVSEVETIPRKNIEATPAMTASNASRPIEGIAKLDDRLIILLNLAKVILPNG